MRGFEAPRANKTLKFTADMRASKFFYFEDDASRRLRPEQLTRAQALDAAKVFAGGLP